MPQYEYQCDNGHLTVEFFNIDNYPAYLECFNCAERAGLIISVPILVKASADVCYDSPIDGKPITSWAARREDLARNNCTPYEPDRKQDYHARIKEAETALDNAIEATVEEVIEQMSTKKRGQLHSELTEQGVTADVIRTTPHA